MRPNTNKKEDTHSGILFLILTSGRKGTRMIQCGADERRRRRLDGAEPLFSFAKAKENANESLPVYLRGFQI